jgi:hypothetical protein
MEIARVMVNVFPARSKHSEVAAFPAQVRAGAWPRTSTQVSWLVALLLFVLGSSAMRAAGCSPHCDFSHGYGPYDLTYIRPGLYAYPVCWPRGDCAPYVVYTYARYRKRILIRPRPWRAPLPSHQ